MSRDFHANAFLSATLDAASAEDADPRIGLVNLADVMLVFACGLMLALVTFWNLDISSLQEVVQSDEVAEVSDIEDLESQLSGVGSGYEELGMVYRDPMTGKLYMLSEDISAGSTVTPDASTGETADLGGSASEAPTTGGQQDTGGE
jgi:hypothetical protein